jgi:hypothetical protein
MAHVRFTVPVALPIPADEAYALLCDWADHARWVPFTRVDVHDEDTFTAYTGIGRLVLIDHMAVTARNDEGRELSVAKLGPTLRGAASFRVVPLSATASSVLWTEDVAVPFLPRVFAQPVAWVARRSFRAALKRLPR